MYTYEGPLAMAGLSEKVVEKVPESASKRMLEYSAKHGRLNIIKSLVTSGARVRAPYTRCFVIACEYGHLGIVKYLMGHGIKTDADVGEAMALATKNGHDQIVKYLLASGVRE